MIQCKYTPGGVYVHHGLVWEQPFKQWFAIGTQTNFANFPLLLPVGPCIITQYIQCLCSI